MTINEMITRLQGLIDDGEHIPTDEVKILILEDGIPRGFHVGSMLTINTDKVDPYRGGHGRWLAVSNAKIA